MVNSCTLGGGCTDRFLMTKVCTEDGRNAARSFCLLRFSLAASCVSASNSQLTFLTYESLSWFEAPCCNDWSLIPTVQAVSSADLCNTFLDEAKDQGRNNRATEIALD